MIVEAGRQPSRRGLRSKPPPRLPVARLEMSPAGSRLARGAGPEQILATRPALRTLWERPGVPRRRQRPARTHSGTNGPSKSSRSRRSSSTTSATDECLRHSRGRASSCHFWSGRDGGLWQFVSLEHRAWRRTLAPSRTDRPEPDLGQRRITGDGTLSLHPGAIASRPAGRPCSPVPHQAPWIAGHQRRLGPDDPGRFFLERRRPARAGAGRRLRAETGVTVPWPRGYHLFDAGRAQKADGQERRASFSNGCARYLDPAGEIWTPTSRSFRFSAFDPRRAQGVNARTCSPTAERRR
jgi:hypothetical protein